MPRLYLLPSQFSSYPASLTFPVQVGQLNAIAGAMDMLLARASERCDAYCRKRLQSPGITTIATGGGIAAGATSISVTSTLGFDDDQEQAVIIGSGATQEFVALQPGATIVSNWASPYPGTLALAQPTQYAHSAGETIQGCYQEVSEIGSSASSDVYAENLIALNQDAQLARAHAPHMNTGTLVRVLFLKQYPITSLLKLEIMLPIDSQFENMNLSNVTMNPMAGLLKLPLGSFVLPEGKSRVTYTAGYTNVPLKVQQATAWYAADELQTMVSMGAFDMLQGKRRGRYAEPTQPKSLYEQRAEGILDAANLRRRT